MVVTTAFTLITRMLHSTKKSRHYTYFWKVYLYWHCFIDLHLEIQLFDWTLSKSRWSCAIYLTPEILVKHWLTCRKLSTYFWICASINSYSKLPPNFRKHLHRSGDGFYKNQQRLSYTDIGLEKQISKITTKAKKKIKKNKGNL